MRMFSSIFGSFYFCMSLLVLSPFTPSQLHLLLSPETAPGMEQRLRICQMTNVEGTSGSLTRSGWSSGNPVCPSSQCPSSIRESRSEKQFLSKHVHVSRVCTESVFGGSLLLSRIQQIHQCCCLLVFFPVGR